MVVNRITAEPRRHGTRSVLVASAALVLLATVAGCGLFASAWIDAKRRENADLDCLDKFHAQAKDGYVVVRDSRRGYLCVYVDRSGRTVQQPLKQE
jgi:hypothetical protein